MNRVFYKKIFLKLLLKFAHNKRLDLKSIDSYLVRIEKLKELSLQHLQQLILQLEDEGELVNKKFKGPDSFLITKTKTTADPPQSPNPFFPVTQDTPLTTPSLIKFRIFRRSYMNFERKCWQ